MKRVIFLLIACVFLWGCEKEEEAPIHRVVTGVAVEYHRGNKILRRHYTKTENVQSILNYLRILEPFGPVIPEEGDADSCRSTVEFSSGPDTVYEQRGSSYICCNDGDWEQIDSNRATLLFPMLLLMPSDT